MISKRYPRPQATDEHAPSAAPAPIIENKTIDNIMAGDNGSLGYALDMSDVETSAVPTGNIDPIDDRRAELCNAWRARPNDG